MHSIRHLEDLIVAIFFSKYEIKKTPNGKTLKFKLSKRKISLLHSYVQRNGIESHIEFSDETGEGHIKQCVLLENMLRDWTQGGEVVALDPRKIKTSTFLLWISLFARKTEKSVAIDTNLPYSVQKDIPFYFDIHFDTSIYLKGEIFYIKPFHSVVSRSIQVQRPAIENIELNYLLPENDRNEFKKEMFKWEEELYPNGYNI